MNDKWKLRKPPPGGDGCGKEEYALSSTGRIFLASLLTIVLVRLSQMVPGFVLESRADIAMMHMVMWLNLNEVLKND